MRGISQHTTYLKAMRNAKPTLPCVIRGFHITGFIAHIVVATTTVVLTMADQFPLPFTLTRNALNVVDEYKNKTCVGRTYDREDFKDWISCVATSYNSTPPISYRVENVLNISGGIGYLISAFTLITGLFHLASLVNKDYFTRLQDKSSQPLRWIEYSITYTIMTLCIFQLNGIHGIYETALLIVSSVAQMIIGYAIEALRHNQPLSNEPNNNRGVRLKMSRGRRVLDPHGIPCFKQFDELRRDLNLDTDTLVICLLELIACFIMLIHFVCIWHSFYVSFVPYINSDAGDMWLELYAYIIVLNVVIYTLYSLFPLVHIIVFFNKNEKCTCRNEAFSVYAYGELAYVALSITSKLALVTIVAFGAQRNT